MKWSPTQLRYVQLAIFALVAGVLLVLMGTNQLLDSFPIGTHFIRQTDGLSQAISFSELGNSMAQPQTLGELSTDGKGGSEFPLVYKLASTFSSDSSPEFFWIRLLSWITMLWGIWNCFKLGQLIGLSDAGSALCTIAGFSSTLVFFYGPGLLPDTLALGLSFVGLRYGYSYYSSNLSRELIIAFIAFALAGLFKVTYFIHPLALGAFLIFDKEHARRSIWPIVAGTLVVLLWWTYIGWYNANWNSETFLSGTASIFECDNARLQAVINSAQKRWAGVLWSRELRWGLFVLMGIGLLSFKKKEGVRVGKLLLWMLIGATGYIVLFYSKFHNHDYYYLNLFPLFLVCTFAGWQQMEKGIRNIKIQWVLRLLLFALAIQGLVYAQGKCATRGSDLDQYSRATHMIQFSEATVKLLQGKQVLVWGDSSSNGVLCKARCRGISYPGPFESHTKNRLDKFESSWFDFIIKCGEYDSALPEWPMELLETGDGYQLYRVLD